MLRDRRACASKPWRRPILAKQLRRSPSLLQQLAQHPQRRRRAADAAAPGARWVAHAVRVRVTCDRYGSCRRRRLLPHIRQIIQHKKRHKDTHARPVTFRSCVGVFVRLNKTEAHRCPWPGRRSASVGRPPWRCRRAGVRAVSCGVSCDCCLCSGVPLSRAVRLLCARFMRLWARCSTCAAKAVLGPLMFSRSLRRPVAAGAWTCRSATEPAKLAVIVHPPPPRGLYGLYPDRRRQPPFASPRKICDRIPCLAWSLSNLSWPLLSR